MIRKAHANIRPPSKRFRPIALAMGIHGMGNRDPQARGKARNRFGQYGIRILMPAELAKCGRYADDSAVELWRLISDVRPMSQRVVPIAARLRILRHPNGAPNQRGIIAPKQGVTRDLH
jgi:hypothetical protein